MIQLLSLLVLLFCCAHRWCWPFVGGGSDFFWLDAGVVQMPVCAQGWEGAHNLACLRGHSIKSPCYIHFHAHSWGTDRQVHWRRHHGLLVRPRSIPLRSARGCFFFVLSPLHRSQCTPSIQSQPSPAGLPHFPSHPSVELCYCAGCFSLPRDVVDPCVFIRLNIRWWTVAPSVKHVG